MKHVVMMSFLAVGLSGCWSFNVSEYPSVALSKSEDGKNLSVAVNGFEAMVTEYESVYGYSTVYVPGYVGYHRCYPGYYETVSTQTVVPQTRTTDTYLKRARAALEDAGFILSTSTTPDRTIEVSFSGPAVSAGDTCKQWGLRFATVFFCDWTAETWTATMRIRDNRTGKLLLKQSYEQRYEANAAGLLPIFGIASCDATSSGYIQNWCLSALTDRVMADATALLAK